MYSLANLMLPFMISSFLYTFMLVNFQRIKVKKNYREILLMFIVLTICIGIGARLFTGVIKIGILYIFVTLSNYLIFNKDKKESTIYSLVTYAIIIVSEVIGAIILIAIFNVEMNLETINEYSIILNIMIIAISMILLNLAMAIFRKIQFQNYIEESDKHKVILYLGFNLLFLSGFWVYIGTDSLNVGNQMYSLAMVLILLSTNIALILFQSNLSVKEKLIKSISEEKKKRDMYIDVMEELMDNIKSFKHDYTNSMRVLRGYIEEDDNEGAINFLKSISDINEDEKILRYYELKYIKDPGLKGLIISKVSYMIKEDLDFTISVDKTNQLYNHDIKMLDLSRVIGILIDNAIEASELSESKKVFINILENKYSTEIVISNTFTGIVDIRDLRKRGYSTKGKGRGLGLYNVEHILDKYEKVNIFTGIDKDIFFQKIELIF